MQNSYHSPAESHDVLIFTGSGLMGREVVNIRSSDIVVIIIAACAKETGARLVYDSEPDRLVAELLRVYSTEHYRRPSCFSAAAESASRPAHKFRTARDVVCGMWIDTRAAGAERTFEGRRYSFCTIACAEKFDAGPQQYIPVGKRHG